jgi:ubiquinone/menaquinone biosynthesis C-methylase UbiE
MQKCLRAGFLVGLVLMRGYAHGQDNAADVARLVEVLRVAPGQVLADIGTGPEARLTILMAKVVGAAGKVYATDLRPQLGGARRAIQKSGIKNVELLEDQPSKTNLPSECCDGIFIVDVYHQFADPPVMNASLWRALKPGGRLAVIGVKPRGSEAASPAQRDGGDQQGVNPDTVSRALVQAGFTPILSEDRPDRRFVVVVERTPR